MSFVTKRRSKEGDGYSWSNGDGSNSHSMWSQEIKKLLKKLGLC